jgi:hypothetical protein
LLPGRSSLPNQQTTTPHPSQCQQMCHGQHMLYIPTKGADHQSMNQDSKTHYDFPNAKYQYRMTRNHIPRFHTWTCFLKPLRFLSAMCPLNVHHALRPSHKAVPQFVREVGEHYDISEKVSGDMFTTVIYCNIL